MNNDELKDQHEFKYVNEQIVEPSKAKKLFRRIGFIFVAVMVPTGMIVGILWASGKVFQDRETTDETSYFTIERDMTTKTDEKDTTGRAGDKTKELTVKELRKVAEEAGKSVVTIITYGDEQIDVGQEPVSISTGIIIKQGLNILILTDYDSVRKVERIDIKFSDGKMYTGKYKSGDANSRLAILTIAESELDGTTLKLVKEAKLGNSLTAKKGNQVIYLGNPINESLYTDYGMIAGVDKLVVIDRQFKVCHTNINAAGNANGFIVDVDGQVIGIVININNTSQKVLSVIGMSDLESIIIRLSNGKDIPYLGINGQEITDDIISNVNENMPYGVFVIEAILDSPVYNAGIRNGDIIVKMGSKEIRNVSDIGEVLEEVSIGDSIVVEIRRQERDEYSSYKIEVVLGKRN